VVAAPDTLAGLVTVPSANALSVPARRDTRATDTVETPLPRPNPDRLDPYSEGMAIGQPLDAHREPQAEALRIPPAALTRHYARYGPTGSGKSTAIQNDLLSLHATTRGPSVLVDRKGDGMVENYLRAHYARFGDLEDVYYLSMPEALPAVPFFDVRPGLAAGRDRETVVQEKVEHFRELLRLVMGEDLFEQAFVANEILAFLIKALFDERYQHDAFGLEELTEAALTMQRDQTLPATSTKLDDVEASLARQFEKDPGQFIQSTDAVLNRLDSLRENTHLADVLRTTPDWDPNSEAYGDGTFDFRRIIDEDCVVLLDMGDLRAESSRALTLILLSNLWDALQYRQQAADNADTNASDDRLVNLIIEEAAPLVASSLVHEDLLPKGRSFGLGLGLVMQFPEQVQSVAADRGVGRRAYRELLNNVHTQILGGITLTDDFADSLVAEDLSVRQLKQRCNQLPAGEWIVDLPQLPFLEPPARPLSVRSLPIPEGHPESDTPLSDRAETVFREELTTVEHRSRASFAIDAGSTPIGSGPLGSASASDPSSGGTSADWGASSGVQPQTVSESPGQSTPAGAPLPSTTDDGSGGDEESWASPEDDPPAEVVLKRVLAAMNRDLDGYSLLDSMTEIVDVDGVDVDDLVDDGYLEKHSVCRRRYYSITEQGQRCIPGHLETGEGIGDLGEKTPHKVGVEALRAWLAAKPTVDEVRIYHEHGGVVYDVAAFAGDSLAWVGEVETDTNDYESIADDYQKLAAVDAEAVWAVPKKSVATETVLPALAAADAIPTAPTGQPARTMSELRETVADWDCDGIGSIWGFTGLTEEVDHS
jgi:DNA helicase HerA-like ATPase